MANLHDAQAIRRADFVPHPVEMVFHCLFREAEVVRNFLVREPFGNQWHQLLFSPRHPILRRTVAEGKEVACLSKYRNKIAQSAPGQTASPACSARTPSNTSFAEASRGKFPLTPARRHCRNSDSSPVANQEDLHSGSRRPRHANRGQIVICISARGQDPQEVFRPKWFYKVRSRDFDLTALDQHSGNRLSQQALVRGHKDARLPVHNRAAVHPRGNFSRRFIGPEIVIRNVSLWSWLCFLQNLLRSCIHRGTSSMSTRSHAYASRHDQRFGGAPRVHLNDAILPSCLSL